MISFISKCFAVLVMSVSLWATTPVYAEETSQNDNSKAVESALFQICIDGVASGVKEKLEADKKAALNTKNNIGRKAIENMEADPIFQAHIKSTIESTCNCAVPKIKDAAILLQSDPSEQNSANLDKVATSAFDTCLKKN